MNLIGYLCKPLYMRLFGLTLVIYSFHMLLDSLTVEVEV
jgi:hypothetical protein